MMCEIFIRHSCVTLHYCNTVYSWLCVFQCVCESSVSEVCVLAAAKFCSRFSRQHLPLRLRCLSPCMCDSL